MSKDLRLFRAFCMCQSFTDMETCCNYKRISKADKACAHSDPVIGMYDGLSACTLNEPAESREPKKAEPVDLEQSDDFKANTKVLTERGYFPHPDVKFIQTSGTYIIRIQKKPRVDFFATKSKWKDVDTKLIHFGDANDLIKYLNKKDSGYYAKVKNFQQQQT